MREGVGFPRGIIDDWVLLWDSYDLDRVRDLFIDDERVTYFSSEKKGIIKGIEALVEHHRGFGFVPGGKAQPNRLWLEDLGVECFEGCAVATAIWCFQRGDSGMVQRGPVTLVYVRAEDGYRIAHANFSNY
ncbi:MAG: nuclear transport factor 2 family protein [Candidatus Bathyarchaeota archaeon]|jgi:hypothetical protein